MTDTADMITPMHRGWNCGPRGAPGMPSPAASGALAAPVKPISDWTIRGCRANTQCWKPHLRDGFWST